MALRMMMKEGLQRRLHGQGTVRSFGVVAHQPVCEGAVEADQVIEQGILMIIDT